MYNNKEFRAALERGILTSFLFQYHFNEMDEMEYKEFILPYELFKANRTHKLVAKAIYVLQTEKTVVSDATVIDFIERKCEFNKQEMIDILADTGFTFDTMQRNLVQLKKIEAEDAQLNMMAGL